MLFFDSIIFFILIFHLWQVHFLLYIKQVFIFFQIVYRWKLMIINSNLLGHFGFRWQFNQIIDRIQSLYLGVDYRW